MNQSSSSYQNGSASTGSCNGRKYVIKKGDTLYSISRRYNVPLAMVLRANPYVDVYNLQIGDEICIPSVDESTTPAVIRPAPMTSPGMEMPEPVVRQPMQGTSPVVRQPMQETSPVVRPPMQETSPVVRPPMQGTGPVVRQPMQETSPVVRPPMQGTSPVVRQPMQETSPVVRQPMQETSPVVRPPMQGTSPVVRPPMQERPATPMHPSMQKNPGRQESRKGEMARRGSGIMKPEEETPVIRAKAVTPVRFITQPDVQKGDKEKYGRWCSYQDRERFNTIMNYNDSMMPEYKKTCPSKCTERITKPVTSKNMKCQNPCEDKDTMTTVSYVSRDNDTLEDVLNYFTMDVSELFQYNVPNAIQLKPGCMIQVPCRRDDA